MAVRAKNPQPRAVAPTPKPKPLAPPKRPESPTMGERRRAKLGPKVVVEAKSAVLSPELHKLVTQVVCPSDVNLWLSLPNPALGGMTPRQAIDGGQEWRLRQAIQRAISGEPSS